MPRPRSVCVVLGLFIVAVRMSGDVQIVGLKSDLRIQRYSVSTFDLCCRSDFSPTFSLSPIEVRESRYFDRHFGALRAIEFGIDAKCAEHQRARYD